MDWKNFIITYWGQVAVIIAALGYLIKVLLDFSLKKKGNMAYSIRTKKNRASLKVL